MGEEYVQSILNVAQYIFYDVYIEEYEDDHFPGAKKKKAPARRDFFPRCPYKLFSNICEVFKIYNFFNKKSPTYARDYKPKPTAYENVAFPKLKNKDTKELFVA